MSQKDWSVLQRQPVRAVWLSLLRTFGQIGKALWPAILLWAIGSKKNGTSAFDYLLIAVPAIIFTFSILGYFFFRFSLNDEQLTVNKGVFIRKNILFPLNKIQAVHIEQNWLHKLLNLVQVSFDTPGTEQAEVKMDLEESQAEWLKAHVLSSSAEIHDKPESRKNTIASLAATDLIKLGLSANHLETLAIMGGLGFSFFNDIRNIIEDRYGNIIERSATDIAKSGFLFFVYAGITILVISIVISLVRIVLQYANFTVSKTEKGFSVRGGLINTKDKLIPYNKIQYVSWRANWLRTLIPIYLLEYHSIGAVITEQKLRIRIPVTSKELLGKLVGAYHDFIAHTSPFLTISKAYVYRRTLMVGMIPFIVLGGILFFFVKWYALFAVVIPVLVFISGSLFQKKFRFYYTEEVIQIQRGTFGQSEAVLQWHKIQSVKLQQSRYQQRHSLATVKLYSAGGEIRIPFLELNDAQAIRDYALYAIESRKENWM